MSSSGPGDSTCPSSCFDPSSASSYPPSSASSYPPSSTSSVESSGGEEDSVSPAVRLLYPAPRPSALASHLLRVPLRTCPRHSGHAVALRRKREMTPAEKKDTSYWDKRQKNNEAARRSREKRRLNDLMMEGELLSLSDENAQLRAEMLALQYSFSLGARRPHAAAGSVPAGMCLPPRPPAPYLYPVSTLLQAGGRWGRGGRDAFVLGRGQHEVAAYPLGHGWPPLSADGAPAQEPGEPPKSQGGFKQELLPFHPFACTPSPGKGEPGSPTGQTGDKRAEAPPQPQGPSTHHVPASTLLPVPAVSSAPASVMRPESWLMPPLHHPAWQNQPMVPWGSGYLSHPGLYPRLPLYMALE
ncbi:uncharacterized protein si:dkey-172o19.2 [Gadus macrocephalus]|uniref:uncharacterized protein si:dkey-172o19.2 n=1 Tax=Gadus macrocephalus TaxID=80720 RepID=UPI0028CB9EA7|nr:uncharacterized protein si:dkey-172o19.2 [Gadus macrocephalus]